MNVPILRIWNEETQQYEGVPAIRGEPGATPVKGTDYWTDADKQEIIEQLKDEGTQDIDVATDTQNGLMSATDKAKLDKLKGIKSEIVMLKDVTLTKGAMLEDQIITFPTQYCNADNYICKFFISSWPKSTWTDAFVFNVHSDCSTVIGTPGTLFAYNQFGLATMATQKYDLIAQFIYYDE